MVLLKSYLLLVLGVLNLSTALESHLGDRDVESTIEIPRDAPIYDLPKWSSLEERGYDIDACPRPALTVCRPGMLHGPPPRVVPPSKRSLEKRTFLTQIHFPDQTVDQLIVHQLYIAKRLQTNLENLEPGGVATSSSKMVAFGDQSFPTGVGEQEGCTTIWVIAKEGMWAAHIWEVPSMMTPRMDTAGNIYGLGPPKEEDFQRLAVNFIRDGDGQGKSRNKSSLIGGRSLNVTIEDNPGLAQYCGQGKIFDPANVLAIHIVTPQAAPGIPMVRESREIDRIKSEVLADLIPGVEPRETLYDAKDEFDPDKLPRDGTVVVQFDPKHPDAQGQLRPTVRVYVAGNRLPDLTW
ncbi:MAG: hypothetical protein Q9227_008402 [Pyrenula ochraceoflavens]